MSLRRLLSTAAASSKSASTVASAPTSASLSVNAAIKIHQSPTSGKLTWSEYFDIKGRRNKARVVGGVPFFFGGLGLVMGFVEFNPFNTILEMDPTMVVGFGAVCAGFASYQIGTGVGALGWRALNRKLARDMDKMDKEFYAKIKHYRAHIRPAMAGQATGGGGGMPGMMKNKAATDYYGEKIKTIGDYRAWLRYQTKLNRTYLNKGLTPFKPTLKLKQ